MIGQDEMKDAWNQGKKLGPNPNKNRYTCDKTGAHFEHNDMCRRIQRLIQVREVGLDHYIHVCLNIHTQMNAICGEVQPGHRRVNGSEGAQTNGQSVYAPTQHMQLNRELKDQKLVQAMIKKQRQDSQNYAVQAQDYNQQQSVRRQDDASTSGAEELKQTGDSQQQRRSQEPRSIVQSQPATGTNRRRKTAGGKSIIDAKDSAAGLVPAVTAITQQTYPTQNTQPDEPDIELTRDSQKVKIKDYSHHSAQRAEVQMKRAQLQQQQAVANQMNINNMAGKIARTNGGARNQGQDFNHMAVARMNGRSPAVAARNSQGSIFENNAQTQPNQPISGPVFKNGMQHQQFASQGHNVNDAEEIHGGYSNPNAPPSHTAALHHYSNQPGGSFDSNMRMKEIRERNMALNKPASKVGIRNKHLANNAIQANNQKRLYLQQQMMNNTSNGFSPKTTTNNLRSSLANGSTNNRDSTVTSLKEKAGQLYSEQNQLTDQAIKSTYFYNNKNNSNNGRIGGGVGVSVYTDHTHSSADDSVERRSAGGPGQRGARILVQPEPQKISDTRYSPVKIQQRLPGDSVNSATIRLHNATTDKGQEVPAVYARNVAGSQIQNNHDIPIVHKRVASLHSKTTGQPGTHAASKRLSQKSSKHQFHLPGNQLQQHSVQAVSQGPGQMNKSFSPPGRKLNALPAQVQQQLIRSNGIVADASNVQSQAGLGPSLVGGNGQQKPTSQLYKPFSGKQLTKQSTGGAYRQPEDSRNQLNGMLYGAPFAAGVPGAGAAMKQAGSFNNGPQGNQVVIVGGEPGAHGQMYMSVGPALGNSGVPAPQLQMPAANGRQQTHSGNTRQSAMSKAGNVAGFYGRQVATTEGHETLSQGSAHNGVQIQSQLRKSNQPPLVQHTPSISKTGMGFAQHKRVKTQTNGAAFGPAVSQAQQPMPGAQQAQNYKRKYSNNQASASRRQLLQGNQSGTHQRQSSLNVNGKMQQATPGSGLYEKRGRNSKGQMVYGPQGHTSGQINETEVYYEGGTFDFRQSRQPLIAKRDSNQLSQR